MGCKMTIQRTLTPTLWSASVQYSVEASWHSRSSIVSILSTHYPVIHWTIGHPKQGYCEEASVTGC